MNSSATLAQAGRRLYGDAWPHPMAAAIGTNVRTLQRIRGAALDEVEHPAAEGALEALREALQSVLTQIGEPP